MLECKHVQKYYGSFLAINIPALFIEEGIWWVQGVNGSGKTTFLKMLAGLHPFMGEITLDNKFSISKQRRQYVRLVNFVEAEPLYPSFLTAKDLVELYCETKAGDLLQAQDLLKKLNVFKAYNKPIGSYSSGMIKKVSLVLAFIGKPKLILLDEPLITIDVNAVDTICEMIKERFSEGSSFIITSHQALQSGQLLFTGELVAENKSVHKTANDKSL